MKIAIFLNGDVTEGEHDFERAAQADMRIAANGGSRYAMELGVSLDLVVGDLDSISERVRNWLSEGGVAVQQHSRDKDFTDFELALAEAVRHSPQEIEIFGAHAGRVDHLLLNFFIPVRMVPAEIRLSYWGRNAYVVRITPHSQTSFHKAAGATLSLLSLSPLSVVNFVTGTRWEMRNQVLAFGEGRGISNVIIQELADVSVSEGVLLAIQQKEVN